MHYRTLFIVGSITKISYNSNTYLDITIEFWNLLYNSYSYINNGLKAIEKITRSNKKFKTFTEMLRLLDCAASINEMVG